MRYTRNRISEQTKNKIKLEEALNKHTRKEQNKINYLKQNIKKKLDHQIETQKGYDTLLKEYSNLCRKSNICMVSNANKELVLALVHGHPKVRVGNAALLRRTSKSLGQNNTRQESKRDLTRNKNIMKQKKIIMKRNGETNSEYYDVNESNFENYFRENKHNSNIPINETFYNTPSNNSSNWPSNLDHLNADQYDEIYNRKAKHAEKRKKKQERTPDEREIRSVGRILSARTKRFYNRRKLKE
jgi:hypothetical protein